jgi:hypothetical protein
MLVGCLKGKHHPKPWIQADVLASIHGLEDPMRSLFRAIADLLVASSCGSCLAGGVSPMGNYEINGPIDSPVTTHDAVNKYWVLWQALEWEIGNSGVKITIPAGFVHDYASVPPWLRWSGLGPHGRYSRATLIHDYLYWSQACTRPQADRLLVVAMKESHVNAVEEFLIFRGVNDWGQPAWDENRDERTKGWVRVLSQQHRQIPPNVEWPSYRKQLIAQGVKDDWKIEVNPPYCRFGDSTEVPGGVKYFSLPKLGKPMKEGPRPMGTLTERRPAGNEM